MCRGLIFVNEYILNLRKELEKSPETYWKAKQNWRVASVHTTLYGEEAFDNFQLATEVLSNKLLEDYTETLQIFEDKTSYKKHNWKGRVWNLRKAFKDYRRTKMSQINSKIVGSFTLDGSTEAKELESAAKKAYLSAIEDLLRKGTSEPGIYQRLKSLTLRLPKRSFRQKLYMRIGQKYRTIRNQALKLSEEYDELFGGELFEYVDSEFSNFIEGKPIKQAPNNLELCLIT